MIRLLPAVGFLVIGTAPPLAAQTLEFPQPVRTQEYETIAETNQVDRTGQATDVKFHKDEHQRMTVPVRVAGSGPYRFLIDTGADRSAISRDLAKRLRLASNDTATLHTVTGASQVGTATVSVLDLTAKRVTNVDAAVLEAGNMGADGILGLDSLRSQRILFDFKKQTLRVVPSKLSVPSDDDTIVVTGRIRNGRLVLTNARAENRSVTLIVDTGAEISIGNEALRRKLGRSKKRLAGTIELVSVTGEKLVGEYIVLRELELGGATLKDLPIVFADSHAFGQIGLADRPALLLGMNALRGFEKVSIDFARKKLRVVLPEKSALDRAVFASR